MSKEGDRTPQQSDEEAVMRFAVSEPQPAPQALLAMITISRRKDGEYTLQLGAQSQEAFARLTPLLTPFRFQRSSAPPPNDLPNGQELIDMLTAHGLVTQQIPLGDSEIQIQIDLQSGRVVGSHKEMHSFANSQEDISQRVFAAVAKSFEQACDDLADRMSALLDEGNIEGASRALEAGGHAIALSGTSRLLAALQRMDVSALAGEDRRRLVDYRLTLSQRLRRYDIGSQDAEWLLREEKETLNEEKQATLKMAIALGSLYRGNRETGLAQLRSLLADPAKLSAEQRGWAWRNLSLALGGASAEAKRAAKHSADAFLEAGLKNEAGRSSKGFVDALMNESPEAAIASLSASINLLDKEELGNRPVYAAALHTRGNRLMTLGRFDEAYRDATASIELLHGLFGTEEQLVSSLHLAALSAFQIGKEAEAEKFEAEAATITEKHGLSHFQMAERLSELAASFEEAKAEALLKDAEAAGNADIVAAVRMYRANGAPNLEPSQRLALLEDALRDSRGEARSEIVDMIKASIGIQLKNMDAFDRAATWFQEVVDRNPLNSVMRDNLIDCLWKTGQWSAAGVVIHRIMDVRGEAPGLLYAYAKSLFESGNIDGALTAAQRSIKSTKDEQVDLRAAATELRDSAIELGGKIERPTPEPQAREVSRQELEDALQEFSRFIAGRKRMTFWRMDDKKREWAHSPEGHAQNLLHTYLQAKFGDRVDIFEELDTGAGRLDLYIKLNGGLSVVLELKMCGGRYSSNYAASGETQIEHYMDNRKTHLGYLVVFDARATMQAKPLLSPAPRHTIVELFVDVRPDVA
jgi:hypothetical protein